MNINGLFIGNGRNITINSVGGKSTVIVNGKVIECMFAFAYIQFAKVLLRL